MTHETGRRPELCRSESPEAIAQRAAAPTVSVDATDGQRCPVSLGKDTHP